VQAIADSQREMRGRTLEARLEVWRRQPAYLVRTHNSNQVWQSRIDANSGQPLSMPRAIPKGELSTRLQRDATALDRAQTSVTDAISKAEQQQGGKAIMVSVKVQANGSAAYDVDLVNHGHLHTAVVNAQS
jgi:uncharacterized membrane protein YkoI